MMHECWGGPLDGRRLRFTVGTEMVTGEQREFGCQYGIGRYELDEDGDLVLVACSDG